VPTPADRPAAAAAAAADQYLDAKTAAVRLNLPLNTIYRMIGSGKLPALRFPVRIHPDELARVVERCRIKPGELRHLNQYSGRPQSGVAEWFRSKAGGQESAGPARQSPPPPAI
jgi:excisionase family DNA binding protein